MSARPKNLKLIEACGNFLFRKLASAGWLFHLNVYRKRGDVAVEVDQITNISPAAGRDMANLISSPGAKIESNVFFMDAHGNVARFAPAASEGQIAKDAHEAANVPQPIKTEGPRGIYRPGEGWTK